MKVQELDYRVRMQELLGLLEQKAEAMSAQAEYVKGVVAKAKELPFPDLTLKEIVECARSFQVLPEELFGIMFGSSQAPRELMPGGGFPSEVLESFGEIKREEEAMGRGRGET